MNTSTSTSLETLDDAELISAVRGGDVEAYGTLFERHVEAARRLAAPGVGVGCASAGRPPGGGPGTEPGGGEAVTTGRLSARGLR